MATSQAAPRLPEVRPPLQPLPSRGRPVTHPGRDPALMVKKKLAHRAVLPQKKVQDASTQTGLPSPARPGNPNLSWGGAALPMAPSSHTIAEKLGAVQMEVQRLSQALHVVLEKQCHLEQELQQQLQQEMLVTLQQLSSTISHGAVPANQPCLPFSGGAKPSPIMFNFSQFKMELL